MKKSILIFGLIALLTSVSCTQESQSNTNQEMNAMDQLDSTEEIVEVESEKDIDVAEMNEGERLYVIDANGDLLITIGDQTTTLAINALSDSHILQDDQGRLLILTDPTEQYQHGILGDTVEASAVTIVDVSEKPVVLSKFSVSEDWVIESIVPIWSDWDLDGEREIVLTLSNSSSGAKLVLYDEAGTILAETEAIGQGNRWRHALEIASFGEDGESLLVDVQTPHIGGIVSFYSWDQENKVLKTEASISQYSTHDIGSREMQMYVLVTDEESEQVLLLLPNQSKTELVALRFMADGIQEEWRISLGGKLTSNLELIEVDGVKSIRAIIDKEHEVLVDLPK